MHVRRDLLIAALLALTPAAATAQATVDGSDAALAPGEAEAVLALVGRELRSPDARVAGLRKGRVGAVCGGVEVRNRMGTYTGTRPFVADLAADFAGRLPEPPELRSPGSVAAFRAMERAQALYAANCAE